MKKRDTILFDLDGTLLPIDFDRFLRRYFQALTAEFKDLAAPERFIKVLMEATGDMINNNGDATNKEVFERSFFDKIKVSNLESTMKRFDRFYEEKFPLLKADLQVNDLPAELVGLLKKKGYRLAIATNPLFPRTAILERMNWAGLDPDDFIFITNYECMHYAKPGLGFYQELINKLDRKAENCIMIGNDLQEDMIAGELGVSTYLIEDFIIDHGTGEIKPDWRGSLEEFRAIVETNFPDLNLETAKQGK